MPVDFLEAASAGFYESPWGKHPRIQLLTIEDLFGEGGFDKPPPGCMPALLTARSPDSPRSYRPALVQSLG